MPNVTREMRDHEATIKRQQSESRRRLRRVPATVEGPADDPVATLLRWRETAKAPAEVLAAVDAAILRATKAPRHTKDKADPAAVAEFFASTGLSRKEIADAVGVSTSVISTVQNENGDRWSEARFEAAKPLILSAAERKRAAAPKAEVQ